MSSAAVLWLLPAMRRLAWMDSILERLEGFPSRLDRVAAGLGRINGGFHEIELGNVPRAVGEDGGSRDAHDQLSADSACEQWVIARDFRRAIDAQAARLAMHVDEQQADMWVLKQVAE